MLFIQIILFLFQHFVCDHKTLKEYIYKQTYSNWKSELRNLINYILEAIAENFNYICSRLRINSLADSYFSAILIEISPIDVIPISCLVVPTVIAWNSWTKKIWYFFFTYFRPFISFFTSKVWTHATGCLWD